MLDKKVLPNGVYSANVSICGLPAKYKTFFPADWPRKKVVEAIFEAYENFLKGSKKHNFTKNGNYRVVAMTSENMEIEMIIQKRGKQHTLLSKENKVERYIKFITREAGSGYWNTEYTKDDGDMDVLGSFLSSEVGCYEPSFKEWAERNDYIGYGGNITELEKDDNYIYLSYDPYIFEGAEVSKFPRQAFIYLLGEWEGLCRMGPAEILITYDGDKFTITTRNEAQEQHETSSSSEKY